MGHRTSLKIDSNVRDELRAMKVADETYNDVLRRLMEEHE